MRAGPWVCDRSEADRFPELTRSKASGIGWIGPPVCAPISMQCATARRARDTPPDADGRVVNVRRFRETPFNSRIGAAGLKVASVDAQCRSGRRKAGKFDRDRSTVEDTPRLQMAAVQEDLATAM